MPCFAIKKATIAVKKSAPGLAKVLAHVKHRRNPFIENRMRRRNVGIRIEHNKNTYYCDRSLLKASETKLLAYGLAFIAYAHRRKSLTLPYRAYSSYDSAKSIVRAWSINLKVAKILDPIMGLNRYETLSKQLLELFHIEHLTEITNKRHIDQIVADLIAQNLDKKLPKTLYDHWYTVVLDYSKDQTEEIDEWISEVIGRGRCYQRIMTDLYDLKIVYVFTNKMWASMFKLRWVNTQ